MIRYQKKIGFAMNVDLDQSYFIEFVKIDKIKHQREGLFQKAFSLRINWLNT